MVELSEEEQVERLRKWWAENGVSLVISIVIGVAALMGWRHWQGWEKQEAAAASAVYETMMNAVQRARSAPDSTADAELARLRAEELDLRLGPEHIDFDLLEVLDFIRRHSVHLLRKLLHCVVRSRAVEVVIDQIKVLFSLPGKCIGA